jgi:hypothetical protein
MTNTTFTHVINLLIGIFNSPLFQLLSVLRENDQWGLDFADDLLNYYATSIVLIGNRGTGTKVHADWSRAKNWTIALCKVRY